MFLVLPILSSEFYAFALDGPNGQGPLEMIEARARQAQIIVPWQNRVCRTTH